MQTQSAKRGRGASSGEQAIPSYFDMPKSSRFRDATEALGSTDLLGHGGLGVPWRGPSRRALPVGPMMCVGGRLEHGFPGNFPKSMFLLELFPNTSVGFLTSCTHVQLPWNCSMPFPCRSCARDRPVCALPALAEFGRLSPDVGQSQSDYHLQRHCPDVGRCLPDPGEIWPHLVSIGQTRAMFRQPRAQCRRAKFSQSRRSRSILAKFGTNVERQGQMGCGTASGTLVAQERPRIRTLIKEEGW